MYCNDLLDGGKSVRYGGMRSVDMSGVMSGALHGDSIETGNVARSVCTICWFDLLVSK